MVLTQQIGKYFEFNSGEIVSIPLWFLRNHVRYGRAGETWIRVSIPLWFLRNLFRSRLVTTKAGCFHTTMVLSQHYEDIISSEPSYPFPYHYGSHATKGSAATMRKPQTVSIPLWFLRNNSTNCTKQVEDPFPYHYGSYATYQ